MLPSFKPKTYQDVKKTLIYYTIFILNAINLLFYFFILSPNQRNCVDSLLGILKEPFSVVGAGISIIIFTFIAWLLISIFEIHDKIYDKYFIKWRYWYSIDFILPRLFRPFANKLDERFLEEAQQNIYNFMKIFYYFVGDYEPKIKVNRVLRFYEKIIKYWITQINEILLLFSLITIIILRHFSDPKYYNVIFNGLIIVILIFIINRFFVKATIISVREVTNDEIEAIHKNYLPDLENELKELCKKYRLNYG